MAVTAGSVIEAIPAAFRRMARTLFQPFDVGKWFVLGFCAWLAQLGEGGGPHFNFNAGGGGPSGPGGGGGMGDAADWVEEHLVVLILAALAVFLLVAGLVALVTWLSSRGKFMFLDGVARNRGAVVEPWRRFRVPANSLFWFRFLFALAVLLALAILGGVCLGVAWVDIARETFGAAAVAAIAIGVLGLLVITLAAGVIGAVLDDFVVPVMYLRGRRVLQAWGVFWRELAAGHIGPLLLFYLMKWLLGMVIGIIAMLACCLTCCIVALPYIGTVILLPVFVFLRCYSLAFIEQYGPDWRVFAYDLEAAPAGPPAAPAAPSQPNEETNE